jgi:hypothetical protein
MYRKWGKKWEESWKDCKFLKWGCKTRYATRTSTWDDTRIEQAYSKDKGTLSAAQNAVMLKFCLALITDELLNNLSDTLIVMSLSALIKEDLEIQTTT